MEPESESVPVPSFVSENPAPWIEPPTVSWLPATVTVRLPLNVTGPVPRLSGLKVVPENAKSAFQFCGITPESVTATPDVLPIVPPLIVNGPVPTAGPRARALLMFRLPAFRITPPVALLALPMVSVPAPIFVSVPPVPLIVWAGCTRYVRPVSTSIVPELMSTNGRPEVTLAAARSVALLMKTVLLELATPKFESE